MRWVDDPETGERVRKEVPVRFRTWFWKDEQGNYMLEVRYGNKRLELKPKKSAIEIGEAKKLVPAMADRLSADLHQFLQQRGQRQMLELLGRGEGPLRVKTLRQRRARSTSGVRVEAEVALTRADDRALTSGAGGTSAVAGTGSRPPVLAKTGRECAGYAPPVARALVGA